MAPTNLRSEIARFGRYQATRGNDFSSKTPCRWQPKLVTDPRVGMCFTDPSAWNLICDLLDSSHVFHPVKLQIPVGQFALETTVLLEGTPEIYIKVQMSQGKAWGRSFHYSDKGGWNVSPKKQDGIGGKDV